MTSDWRDSFKGLKDELRALHEANIRLFHGVILSLDRSPGRVSEIVDTLEPAYGGGELVQAVEIPTKDCACHQHLFFAPDRGPYESFGRKLQKLDEWFAQVPDGLLPSIDLPRLGNQLESNTIRWLCLLYNLAWEYDEHYLQAELECLESLDRIGFYPWFECPQPPACDPRPVMISQGDTSNRISEWRSKFSEAELRFPDLVSAYLLDDVILASLSGIDILIYRAWEEFSGQATLQEAERPPSRKPKKSAVSSEKKRSRGNNAKLDRFLLGGALRTYHFPHNKSPVLKPVKQKELAKLLDWSQSKVSRQMSELFPAGGMEEYKEVFRRKRGRGFLKRLEDGRLEVDGISADDLEDDDLPDEDDF